MDTILPWYVQHTNRKAEPLSDHFQVDSSKVQVRASGHTFRGLPDANDHSRHKDFYAFYLWNYCSGKIVNGTYSVDFCSEPQHSLYDLFRYWKVWGTHVLGERAQLHWLEQGPKLLYVPYSVAGCLAFLTSIMSLSPLANSKVGQIMLILSSVRHAAQSFPECHVLMTDLSSHSSPSSPLPSQQRSRTTSSSVVQMRRAHKSPQRRSASCYTSLTGWDQRLRCLHWRCGTIWRIATRFEEHPQSTP